MFYFILILITFYFNLFPLNYNYLLILIFKPLNLKYNLLKVFCYFIILN